MKLDPVMAEIRAVREAYAEQFGGDVKAMFDDLEKRSRESGREIVSRPPRRIREVPKDSALSAAK
jgi:hypothetical protein